MDEKIPMEFLTDEQVEDFYKSSIRMAMEINNLICAARKRNELSEKGRFIVPGLAVLCAFAIAGDFDDPETFDGALNSICDILRDAATRSFQAKAVHH